MSARDTATTTIMTLVFGVLVGVVGVSFLAYYSGFIAWDKSGQARVQNASPTPGMDMLNAYQCHKAETKHIILGGVEVGFSSNGDESVAHNEVAQYLFERAGHRLAFRVYDEPGFDKTLVDKFPIPARTVSGLVIARIMPPEKLKNDSISIGDLRGFYNSGNFAGTGFDGSSVFKPWVIINNLVLDNDKLVSAKIEDLEFVRVEDKEHDSLLAYIRSNIVGSTSPSTPVYVAISDDTVVDYIDFAVCAEPPENKGLVFTAGVYQIEDADNVVVLSCLGTDARECDPYRGDMLCSETLPLACFK